MAEEVSEEQLKALEINEEEEDSKYKGQKASGIQNLQNF